MNHERERLLGTNNGYDDDDGDDHISGAGNQQELGIDTRQNDSLNRRTPKATLDILFIRRFLRIMSFSGTTFFSRTHLYFWQLVLVSLLFALINVTLTRWTGRATGLFSKSAFELIWEIFPEGIMLGGSKFMWFSLKN